MISAVVPTYNSAAFIEGCLDAITSQSRPVDEIVIADDGSTDNTLDLVLKRRESRVKVLNLPHGGTAKARMAGIKAASGEWIAWCDADDRWHPSKIEKQLAASNGYDVVYSNGRLMRDGTEMGDFWSANRIRPRRGGRELLPSFFWRNPVLSASSFARCSAVLKALEGTRIENGYMDLDYALWLNMLAQGARFTFLSECLVDYGVHDAQQTSRGYETRLWVEGMLRDFLTRHPEFAASHPALVRIRMAKLYGALVREKSRSAQATAAFPWSRFLRLMVAGRP